MRTSDLINETYSSLTVNKARSTLTILGIVIGIASVIAMVALGQGAQQDIEERIQSIGSNLLTISPGAQGGFGFRGVSQGAGSAQTLVLSDAQAIDESIDLVAAVSPEVSSRYQLTTRGANSNTSVTGVYPDYLSVHNANIESGSFITGQNNNNLSKVTVIGPDTATTLFGENVDPIGQKIRINQIDFTVIGVLKARGGTGFGSSDDIALVPLSVMQRFFIGDDHLSSIAVEAQSQSVMKEAQAAIFSLLLSRHGFSNDADADFSIFNQEDIVETASSVTETFTLLLGAVASISLIVGGIGIMNMMLTTVTERTREIGLRKSLGAKNGDISLQFLSETIMLTIIGGIVGILIGWGITVGLTTFGGISTNMTLPPVILAFTVSAVIGIVFGYYPARRAAKLDPIEALRYE